MPTALDERLLRRLERLAIYTSRGLRGGLSGVHPSRRRLPAPTFTDHRPYTTGDDLRYVDWNAYARLGDLQLKLGEAEQDVSTYLMIDCSASMDWGAGDHNKIHYAQLLAAAIGYIALASGDRLQVIPYGQGHQPTWGPGSGRHRAVGLLRYLDGLSVGGSDTSAAILHDIARERRGGLLIVVSDLLHSGGLLAALAPFQPPRWQVLLLHLLHPEELRPDLRGDVELVDSETGARLVVNAHGSALELHTAAVEAWCDRLARECDARNVAYARLFTDMSLERAVLPYLQLREVLQ